MYEGTNNVEVDVFDLFNVDAALSDLAFGNFLFVELRQVFAIFDGDNVQRDEALFIAEAYAEPFAFASAFGFVGIFSVTDDVAVFRMQYKGLELRGFFADDAMQCFEPRASGLFDRVEVVRWCFDSCHVRNYTRSVVFGALSSTMAEIFFMKPFLILQLRPEDETSDDEFRAICSVGGLREEDTVRIRVEQERIPSVDFSQYSGIVVGGSPFDVSLPEGEKSDLQKRVEQDFHVLLDAVIAQDFPFLGACSGNGLLGRHCGASISSRYKEPVGGVDITLTEDGKRDPLLADLPDTFRALVGHKEACDATPPGCVLLASSATCPVQMFRKGEHVYATQFHPEADGDVFTMRINIYRHHGYFSPDEADDLIAAVSKEQTPYAQEILRRFVEMAISVSE